MDNSQNLSAKEPHGFSFDMLFGDDISPEIDAVFQKASDDARMYQIEVVKKHEVDPSGFESAAALFAEGELGISTTILELTDTPFRGYVLNACSFKSNKYVQRFSQTLSQETVHNSIYAAKHVHCILSDSEAINIFVETNRSFMHPFMSASSPAVLWSDCEYTSKTDEVSAGILLSYLQDYGSLTDISYSASGVLEKSRGESSTELNSDARKTLQRMLATKN